MDGSLVNKTDLLALYLSWTYCHKTGTRPPSCVTPQQPTIYAIKNIVLTGESVINPFLFLYQIMTLIVRLSLAMITFTDTTTTMMMMKLNHWKQKR